MTKQLPVIYVFSEVCEIDNVPSYTFLCSFTDSFFVSTHFCIPWIAPPSKVLAIHLCTDRSFLDNAGDGY